ncbi:Tryptophan-tRNA ligase [Acididesulfobacillus acetoxydans]|uniref:Tryptophan--tRNA ligase n=1 Tax=Acididesulfobacillus acetoxydans TaxID=1561005 RepID=A0A8S0XAT2_9FIRM|nr:tryptophan--tRNA ligase [Acididesulfobacillus acetoxydans]CAA7600346.1 Tryptophan-tRNA ligase [Acididesulfobacillus acetoxydans]CEJ07868.1 Tryptophan--tRNA ligase [Acididesulfobacillus acetoxydans]
MRVLSGIQPSGNLHLGNYFGMMKRMIEYQEKSELFAFIVNYHALTTVTDPQLLRTKTLEAAIDFLALGLDPQKSYFWVQSDLPEVQELTWLLSNATGMGLLERCHAYKDKVSKGITPSHGLFAYPVLMAADILICGSNRVPVGKDQKQHVEVARDIAIRFNSMYGETFVIPEADIEEEIATIPGIDGQKMSKSYGNSLEIFAEEKTLRQRIISIKTDSTPVEQPKPTAGNPLFEIYSLFLDKKERENLKDRFETPGLRYGDVKKELFGVIWEFFAPYRRKREQLATDKAYVVGVLKEGAEKVRGVAAEYVSKARRNVGLNYDDL